MAIQLSIDQAMQQAVRRHQAGKIAEAEQIYRQVLTQSPNHPDALHLLGVIAHNTGQYRSGIDLIRRAIAVSPGMAHYHNNLGNVLRDSGKPAEAIAAYRCAIRIKPDYAEAHYNLGVALRSAEQVDEAIEAYRNALRCKPDFANAFNNLGNVLREKGKIEEAIAALRQAVRFNPGLAEAHSNLGNALQDVGRFDEAVTELKEAMRLSPNAVKFYNLAVVLREKGSLDESAAAAGEALRMNPDYAEAHDVLSSLLLLKGDLVRGWQEYEWRWKIADFLPSRRRFTQPRWNGEGLNDRRILLHTDGGLGDTMQFVRYAPMVVERGGKVILDCQPELHSLFNGLEGISQLTPANQPTPAFDVHCPLMSLPRVFGTTIESIPAGVPYLKAEQSSIETWRAQLGAGDGELRVGINWGGNLRFKREFTRSCGLDQLAPLRQIAGAKFYGLHKLQVGEAAKSVPPELRLTDLGPELKTFGDTAAAMSLMDLIITTDTSVAHLAGALGRPVWVMLQFVPDWRWMMDREDSPWYPTMRLFRQKKWGDWNGVIEKVAEALSMKIQK